MPKSASIPNDVCFMTNNVAAAVGNNDGAFDAWDLALKKPTASWKSHKP
jgi:hypothetical protein